MLPLIGRQSCFRQPIKQRDPVQIARSTGASNLLPAKHFHGRGQEVRSSRNHGLSTFLIGALVDIGLGEILLFKVGSYAHAAWAGCIVWIVFLSAATIVGFAYSKLSTLYMPLAVRAQRNRMSNIPITWP